jgi:hypothetical protein
LRSTIDLDELREAGNAVMQRRCDGATVSVIENAFVLAAARRLMRPTDASPLGSIRSLAYFLPVIEEVLAFHVSQEYFDYLRHKLERITPSR